MSISSQSGIDSVAFQIVHNGVPCLDSYQAVGVGTGTGGGGNVTLSTVRTASAGDTFSVQGTSLSTGGTTGVIVFANGSWSTFSVGGSQGVQGVTGPTGVAGPQGATGATGSAGPQGVTGPTGASGQQGLQGATGPTGLASSVTGPTGYAGPQGTTGSTGSAGPQGVTGPTGASGQQGLQGATGPTGPTGPAGTPSIYAVIQAPTGATGAVWLGGYTGVGVFNSAILSSNATLSGSTLTVQSGGVVGVVVSLSFRTQTGVGAQVAFQILHNGVPCLDSYQSVVVSSGNTISSITLNTIRTVAAGDTFALQGSLLASGSGNGVLVVSNGSWSTFSVGGSQGVQGVTGPTGVAGPTGPTGAAGSGGVTGPTGAGATGPTGPLSPWTSTVDANNNALENLKTATFNGEVSNVGSGGTVTIDVNTGQKQLLTLTASSTVALTAPTVGVGNFLLRVIQGGSGSYTITWPTQGTASGNLAWANKTVITLSTAVGAEDLISFYYNGSYWDVSYNNNFG